MSQRHIGRLLGIDVLSNPNTDKRKTLNESETLDVIQLCIDETLQLAIAEDFGVSQQRVSQIFKEFKDTIHTKYNDGYPVEWRKSALERRL